GFHVTGVQTCALPILFERFYQTLCAIDARQKTLDIILTKEVIAIGAERILDMFLPAGITDFSMKMISPYGSGKAFFESNMEEFRSEERRVGRENSAGL